jgi:hypothetical protein
MKQAANLRFRVGLRLPASRISPARQRRGQVARRFFLCFRDLALAGFRECVGLMLRGRPAATGVTAASGSGSGLNWARQGGLSCDLFLAMQAVTRSTSGISALQRRNASLVHACCCSGV